MKSVVFSFVSLFLGQALAAPFLVYQPVKHRFVQTGAPALQKMDLSPNQARDYQRQGFLVEPDQPIRFQQKPAVAPRKRQQEGGNVVWPHSLIRTPEAHRAGALGQGVTICLVDSGVNLRHPSLRGAVTGGINLTDAMRRDDVNDEIGHGTQVATLMVGRPIGTFVGVAPAANLFVAKIADSRNPAFMSNLIEGIRSCFGKAHIINLSVGADQPSAILNDVVAEAFRQGMTVVMASVNERREMAPQPMEPYIIKVGSVANDRKVSIFSGRGQTLDIVAPGEDLPVLNADGRTVSTVSGTSYSAALVSGVDALRRSKGARFLMTSDLGLSPMEQGRGLVDALATVMSR